MAADPIAENPIDTQDNKDPASRIEHTRLSFQPDEDPEAIVTALCREALDHGFYGVCVRPAHVSLAKRLLKETPVKVVTVIGFPVQARLLAEEQEHPTIGDIPLAEKLAELDQALADGADEFDVVLNVGQFKREFSRGNQADERSETLYELQTLNRAANRTTPGHPVKVILETDLLSDAEGVQAVERCVAAGVAMVKTSTGMLQGGQGATVEWVRLLRETLKARNSQIGIKASGGIKTPETVWALVNAGADRLGTSAGVSLVVKGSFSNHVSPVG